MRRRSRSSPSGERDKPTIKLERIPNSDIFEGVTKAANRVYAHDLASSPTKRNTLTRARDAYSFLPTLGESDLFLLGKGDERRISAKKLGGHLRVIDGVPGTSFAARAPNAQRISVVGHFQ